MLEKFSNLIYPKVSIILSIIFLTFEQQQKTHL